MGPLPIRLLARKAGRQVRTKVNGVREEDAARTGKRRERDYSAEEACAPLEQSGTSFIAVYTARRGSQLLLFLLFLLTDES